MTEFLNNDAALIIEIVILIGITLFFTGKELINSNKRKKIALAEICHDLHRIKEHLKDFENKEKKLSPKNNDIVILHNHRYDINVQTIITLSKRIEVAVNLGILDIDAKIIQNLLPLFVMLSRLGNKHTTPEGPESGMLVSALFHLTDHVLETMRDKNVDIEKCCKEYDEFLDQYTKWTIH